MIVEVLFPQKQKTSIDFKLCMIVCSIVYIFLFVLMFLSSKRANESLAPYIVGVMGLLSFMGPVVLL